MRSAQLLRTDPEIGYLNFCDGCFPLELGSIEKCNASGTVDCARLISSIQDGICRIYRHLYVMHSLRLRFLSRISAVLALALTACGGGGSSSGSDVTGTIPSETAEVQCALTTSGASSGGGLSVTTQSCPTATQGASYSGCTIAATGGKPPYSFDVCSTTSYPSLPEGMILDTSNGEISAPIVGGQGFYAPLIQVTDSTGATAVQAVSFEISGNNGYLSQIFPSTSIFHTPIGSLATDNSPAAAIPAVYQSTHLQAGFGNSGNFPWPTGIPVISVPFNQPDVPVATTLYQSYFSSGPIPYYAPVEGSENAASSTDHHVLVFLEAGSGQNPALYEMWQGVYNSSSNSWNDSSNALWANVNSNALTPLGQGTADAAGLPIAPLLLTADEVIGTGTSTAPNGVVRHPIRFTVNSMLHYYVWPATASAGYGTCSDASGTIPPGSGLDQPSDANSPHPVSSSPLPTSCSQGMPAGEIYRLPSSFVNPACASTSPQAAIIIEAMKTYGIIVADNGTTGMLIGTPDARWNDSDLACLNQLTLGDFQPVDVSSLIVNPDSGQVQ